MIFKLLFETTFIFFTLFSLWMFFIFVKNFKKNKTLNKSASKSIFRSKLSILIILIFYTISFSLVGGSSLLLTNGQRSLEKQFNDNNLYQEIIDLNLWVKTNDKTQNNAIERYNYQFLGETDTSKEIKGDRYIDPWIVENTLRWGEFESSYYNDDSNPYWGYEQQDGTYISVDMVDGYINSPPIGSPLIFQQDLDLYVEDTKSIGWTYDEYKEAILKQWEEINTTNYNTIFDFLVRSGIESKEVYNYVFENLFGDSDIASLDHYANTILFLRIANPTSEILNPNGFLQPMISTSGGTQTFSHFNPEDFVINGENYYDKLMNEINGMSYKFSMFKNITVPNSNLKNSYELIIINDIDWVTFQRYESLPDDFSKKTVTENGKDINNIEYSSINEEEFIDSSNWSSVKPITNEYNILIQEEYCQKNDLSNGDEILIKGGVSDLTLTIEDQVRFSEVTYPWIGTNIVPTIEDQAFIGITLSDYLVMRFYNDSLFTTVTEQSFSPYIGFNSGYSLLNSLDSWTYDSNARNSIKKTSNMVFEELPEQWKTSYRIDEEHAAKLIKFIDGNTNSIYPSLNLTDDQIKQMTSEIFKGEETIPIGGSPIKDKRYILTSADGNSYVGILSSIGMYQIINSQKVIKIVMLIFLIIVLIVLTMMISKRIVKSGKQIGTLKALGMKNSLISSTYIIYPMIIIFLGFLFAAILSIPVMYLFTSLLHQWYYISFSTFFSSLSFGFFAALLFIPLVFAIGLSFVISMWVLRKPTLDLLTNKDENYPNFLVRAYGYINPKWASFKGSYKTKGFFRSISKSLVLFLSIFISTFLVAFSMSSSTMVKQQTSQALSYLNFESTSLTKDSVHNKGNYNMQPLWVWDESTSTWHKAYEDTKTKITFSSSMEEQINSLNMKSFKDLNNIEAYDSFFISEYDYNWFLDRVQENLLSYTDSVVEYSVENGIETNYYIDNSYIALITYFNLSFMNESLSDFSNWEEKRSNNGDLTFSSLSPIVDSWLFDFSYNATFTKEEIDINTPLYKQYGTDVVFQESYYNQFTSSVAAKVHFDSYKNASNSEEYYNPEKSDAFSKSILYIGASLDEAKNSFGAFNTTIGDEIYELFYDDYAKVMSGESLGYVPIVTSTQRKTKIDEGVENGDILINDNGIYTASIELDGLNKTTNYFSFDYLDEYNGTFVKNEDIGYSSESILFNFKILDSIYYGVDVDCYTIAPFIYSYFDYYNDPINSFPDEAKPISIEVDEPENYVYIDSSDDSLVFLNSNGNERKRFYKTTSDEYTTNSNQMEQTNKYYTYSFFNENKLVQSKIYPENSEGINNLINPTTSITIEDSFFRDYYRENYDGENLETLSISIDMSEILGLIPTYGDDVYASDSLVKALTYPLSFENLLEQGESVYIVIIAFFVIISFFAIFMSITIISIAMKDVFDSNKREISMLKAFGYSNRQSVFLVMTPYIIIMLLSFIISIPFTFMCLGMIAGILTNLTGNLFIFTLTGLQWFLLMTFILGLLTVLTTASYISFKTTNALEAIRETDE